MNNDAPSSQNQPPLTPEMEKTLSRYLDLQEEERNVKQEKKMLQNILARHLSGSGRKYWFPVVADKRLKVRYEEVTEIEYDEGLLLDRLGERYVHILSPDVRKIKKRMDDVEPLLVEMLDTIGTPDRAKVRRAIQQGLISRNEFEGAFRKSTKTRVAVSLLTASYDNASE